jgi:hypothetical protein
MNISAVCDCLRIGTVDGVCKDVTLGYVKSGYLSKVCNCQLSTKTQYRWRRFVSLVVNVFIAVFNCTI